MKKVFVVTAALLLLCMVGGSAFAGWTVVNLSPAGMLHKSGAAGVSGGKQVGGAGVGGVHAALWSGTAASYVDLHPAGMWTQSYAYGVSGFQQVGYVHFYSLDAEVHVNHASLWSGAANSWIDLHPAGVSPRRSYAYGVSNGWQVGEAELFSGAWHASLWNGAAGSWVDLNPAGAWDSGAYDISGGQQVGCASIGGKAHAGLWKGSAGSWVDLNPAGVTYSSANGVSGGQQVGHAVIGGVTHAGLWNGSAGSWVDLNPAGAVYGSSASGVSGGKQVGCASFVSGPTPYGTTYHAGLWSGTAASWVDLHALLPAGVYAQSGALSVDVSAGEIWVAGWAGDGAYSSRGYCDAMLWHFVPEPSSLLVLLSGVGGLGSLLAFRRRVA